MLPSVVQAAVTAKMAREIRGFDLCVYLRLWDQLDVMHYRWLKLGAIQRALAVEGRPPVHHKSIRRSLRRLEVLGFLERGPRDGRYNTFRIVLSPERRGQLHAS